MAYVYRENARLYWHADGDGEPLLMIMGLSFTHEMWFRVLPHLGSFRTILFDNRGAGHSSIPPGPYTIVTMAEDALAVLDAAEHDSAHVIGASMGGMIAQEIALRHPHRVRTLTLGCTSYSGLFSRWPRFGRGPGLSWFKAGNRLERERSLRPMLYAAGTPEERIEEDIRIRCKCAWNMRGILNQLAGILMWNSYSRLPNLRVPTLVMHGDEDHLLPPENGRIVASRIPGAQFELIRGAGHVLTTDQPEETVRHLLRFLENHRASTADAALAKL